MKWFYLILAVIVFIVGVVIFGITNDNHLANECLLFAIILCVQSNVEHIEERTRR